MVSKSLIFLSDGDMLGWQLVSTAELVQPSNNSYEVPTLEVLSSLTVPELTKLANRGGIPVSTRPDKSKLIATIIAQWSAVLSETPLPSSAPKLDKTEVLTEAPSLGLKHVMSKDKDGQLKKKNIQKANLQELLEAISIKKATMIHDITDNVSDAESEDVAAPSLSIAADTAPLLSIAAGAADTAPLLSIAAGAAASSTPSVPLVDIDTEAKPKRKTKKVLRTEAQHGMWNTRLSKAVDDSDIEDERREGIRFDKLADEMFTPLLSDVAHNEQEPTPEGLTSSPFLSKEASLSSLLKPVSTWTFEVNTFSAASVEGIDDKIPDSISTVVSKVENKYKFVSVFVCDCLKHWHELQVMPRDSVASLKSMVHIFTGLDMQNIVLMHHGKILEDTKSLIESNVVHQDTFSIHIQLRGGAKTVKKDDKLKKEDRLNKSKVEFIESAKKITGGTKLDAVNDIRKKISLFAADKNENIIMDKLSKLSLKNALLLDRALTANNNLESKFRHIARAIFADDIESVEALKNQLIDTENAIEAVVRYRFDQRYLNDASYDWSSFNKAFRIIVDKLTGVTSASADDDLQVWVNF